jgi:L-2,4-diaminobutyrate decarboxylase
VIRKEIIKSGEFYIVQASLDDKIYLRTSLMNALTDDNDLDRLIMAVKRHGSRIVKSAT